MLTDSDECHYFKVILHRMETTYDVLCDIFTQSIPYWERFFFFSFLRWCNIGFIFWYAHNKDSK